MNKRILAMLVCCVLLLLCGCSSGSKKYKRISFKSDAMSEQLRCIKDDTVVVNKSTETFPAQMPIYRIKQRSISEEECQQMCENLGLGGKRYYEFELNGNHLFLNLAARVDFTRGFFEMTEEEGEKLAWELFKKIPFIEGEYECAGLKDKYIHRDSKSSHIARAGFVFCRVVDGVRTVGNDQCTIFLDGSGLVAISIRLFDYEKIGTMDMVSLADAKSKLKSPDDFDIGSHSGNNEVATLQVEKVALRMVNQYSAGCTILQPIYYFTGTAMYKDGYETNFSSKIIAIPEEMTYEED